MSRHRFDWVLASLLLLCGTAIGDTITVCSTGCDHTSINDAIDAASNYDLIVLSAETYREGVVVDTDQKVVTIRGTVDDEGNPTSIIDGQGEHRVLACRSGETLLTVFENLVITNGEAEYGAGMFIDESSPTLANCTFAGNEAGVDGGGVYNASDRWSVMMIGSPNFTNCRFTENHADRHGGGMFNDFSRARLEGCVFIDNTSEENGGAVFNDRSNADFTGCGFTGNAADEKGGGMYNQECTPTLVACDFIENEADIGGGMTNRTSDAELTGCLFTENQSDDGGGVYNDESNPLFNGCSFIGNRSDQGGGMKNTWSSPILDDCVFTENEGEEGGGIFSRMESDPILTNCRLWCNLPNSIEGDFTDSKGNCITSECIECDPKEDGPPDEQANCPGDIDSNRTVDGGDLGLLMSAWGSLDPSADLNHDGRIDGLDLGLILSAWGDCP